MAIVGLVTVLAKYLAYILSYLVGKNGHHINNSQEFVEKVIHLILSPDQVMISYDVSALFPSVPIKDALDIILIKLQNDPTLSDRTPLTPEEIINLLEFCLTTTYFTFRGDIYIQQFGAAMGSPVSPIVANLYMENFETEALNTAPHPPSEWDRYVDDTFVIQLRQWVDELTDHINDVNEHINFTIEPEKDNKLAFLDTCINKQPDGSLKITVYRKPTHTNQYLNFASHHHIQQKLGIVKTLFHRCDSIVTDPADRRIEKDTIKNALRDSGYPEWALNPPAPTPRVDNDPQPEQESGAKKLVVLPYLKGTSERLARCFRKHGVNVAFKPHQTLRQYLVRPKDPVEPSEACGVVYQIPCGDCDETYIGHSGRPLNTRVQEHKNAVRKSSVSSGVADHTIKTGHSIDWEQVDIIDRDPLTPPRRIREAIAIRLHNPAMNRESGYELPRIYDRILKQGGPRLT